MGSPLDHRSRFVGDDLHRDQALDTSPGQQVCQRSIAPAIVLVQGLRLAGVDQRWIVEKGVVNLPVRQRPELLPGLDYVPISRDYILAQKSVRDAEKNSRKKMAEAREKRLNWFRKTGVTWALDIPTLMYYDF